MFRLLPNKGIETAFHQHRSMYSLHSKVSRFKKCPSRCSRTRKAINKKTLLKVLGFELEGRGRIGIGINPFFSYDKKLTSSNPPLVSGPGGLTPGSLPPRIFSLSSIFLAIIPRTCSPAPGISSAFLERSASSLFESR